MTISEVSSRCRLRPAPWPPVPSIAQARNVGMVVGELHQLGIALRCRLDGDLVEDTTSRGVEDRRGVGVDVGVDADDDIDHFA